MKKRKLTYLKLKQVLGLMAVVLSEGVAVHAQAPTVPTPPQTDQIILDNNSNSKADPGDKIRYKVTIQNTGAGNATGVKLNAIPDPRTTLDGASFRTSPLAMPDAYSCIGNVGITVPDGASDLLANDFDDAPAGLTATAGTFATAQGGSITIAANGSFSYNPPRGYEGTDTYEYTLNDGNAVAGVTPTDLGTVTFTVSGMIWFINNNAGACVATCDGRMSNPYTSLADFNTANALAGGLNPDNNDNIFLYENSTAYTGGIVLRNGQKLFGQDATATLAAMTGLTLPPFSNALPVTNSASPFATITNSGGDGVTLADGNTLRGFTVGNCSDFGIENSGTTSVGNLVVSEVTINNTTGGGFDASHGSGASTNAVFTAISSTGGTNGINLTSCAGTFTVNGGTITNPTGTGVLISGGTVTFSSSGAITDNTGFAVDVDNHDSGNVTFSGNITSTGSGIRVQNSGGGIKAFSGSSKSLNTGANAAVTLSSNTGATINFTNGGLIITTTSGTGFSATGGGTVTVQGTGNTINSTSATALNVANTTIGASGLTFQSISSSGASKGISLNSTGTGGLTITGTGTTDGTGGTIQNITTRGAEFISAQNITLKNMNFTNACTADFPAAPTGLSLGNNTADNAAIHLQAVTTVVLDNLNITNSAEQGINGHNVNGFTLSNSALSGLGGGPDEDGLHFYNMVGTCAITNTSIVSSGDDNVNIQNNTTPIAPPISTGTITITGGSFNTGVLGSGLLFGIRGTSNTTIDISGATSNNNFAGGVVADCFDTATMDIDVSNTTITNNNDAVQVSSHNGNTKFDIHDNTNISGQDFVNIFILKSAFSNAGTLEGRIRNNTITTENGHTADGILVFAAGGGTTKTNITNNNIIYAGTQRAILIQGGQDGAATLETTVTGNTIDIQLDGTGNAVAGILAQVIIATPGGNGTTLCTDIGGAGALKNIFTHSLGGSMAGGDIRVRQRNGGPVRLPGYGGAGGDNAAVVSYLTGRNTIISAPTATNDDSLFSGGGACLQPSN